MKTLLSLILLALISTSFAGVLTLNSKGDFVVNSEKVNLFQLVEEYSELTQKNLFISSSISKKKVDVDILGNKIISAANFEKLLISLIVTEQFAVIQSKDKTHFSILRKRDVRYDSLPLYKDITKVPDTDELIYFYKKLSHVSPKQAERAFRPFTSRVGRIYSEVNSKVIVILDSGRNVKNLYELIKLHDTPQMTAEIKAVKELNIELKNIAEKDLPLSKKLETNVFIFIALFSLIFLIIGFILRGFVMRKIEGGY